MREMKDSRVEWIGEIPSTWNTCMVKNIFTITRGRVIAKTEIEENPLDNYYPVYSSQTANSGVLGYIPSFDYAVDSLTWTTDGAKAGTVFLRRGKYSITNVCGILTPKADDCVLEYLYYAVGYSANNCRRADINGFKIMSNEMAVIPLAIPPVEEQKRISTFLLEQETKVDTLVANVQTQIEKLKAYKQSLITEVVNKGLDPTVPMKDSGIGWIGEIPAHWGTAKLQYCARIRSGITLGKKYPKETETIERPYLRVANVQSGGVLLDNLKTVEVSTEDDLQYRLSAGEVLMTEGGDRDKLGRGCVWKGQINPCLHQNHIFALQTNSLLDPQFLAYVTASNVGKRFVKGDFSIYKRNRYSVLL